MSVTINGTNGLTFNDNSTQTTAATGFGFKNRIINGAMVIDQRNAGASITANDATFPVDRFKMACTQTSKLTAQQNAGSVTPPAGFRNYLGLTSSSAYSVGASDFFVVTHFIEGFNAADLGFGTANAQTVTLSFWVRSSLTGTFGGALRNGDVGTRSYPFSYSISAANTWEQKTITIAGDTSGTWNTTNGQGLDIRFGLGVGSTYSGTAGSWSGSNFLSATGATSVVGTNGATFYITGVQLEKGSTATSFDYRPYGMELALCQRYFYKTYNQSVVPGTAAMYAGTGAYILAPDATTNNCHRYNSYPVSMRASPTITGYSPNNGNTSSPVWNSGNSTNIGWNPFNTNENGFGFHTTSSVNATSTCYVHWTASAEL
jgi:hypothetical protein